MCRGMQRGAQRYAEVCGGVWRCAEVCRGVHRGMWRYTEVCASLFVLAYHWLPLATIDLVGDNREFEV